MTISLLTLHWTGGINLVFTPLLPHPPFFSSYILRRFPPPLFTLIPPNFFSLTGGIFLWVGVGVGTNPKKFKFSSKTPKSWIFHQIASIADVTFSTFCNLMQGTFDPNHPKSLIFPQIEATREGTFSTFLTSNAVYIFF